MIDMKTRAQGNSPSTRFNKQQEVAEPRKHSWTTSLGLRFKLKRSG